MLLSGKMLIVGLHVSAEEGMVRAWHIDLGTDLVLPGRHRVRLCSPLPVLLSTSVTATSSCLQRLHLHVHVLLMLHVKTPCHVSSALAVRGISLQHERSSM